jgi:diaminopimelate decarboxylase
MYDAWHGVLPLAPTQLHAPLSAADIAGPVCESSDFLARERPLPALENGDLVAILDTGAYGAVMSSCYNARPAAAQIMLHDGAATLISQRGTVPELYRGEMVPSFAPADRTAE